MKILRSALVYPTLVLLANAGAALAQDWTELRTGTMEKLLPVDPPIPAPATPYVTEAGAEALLSDAGHLTVVNFWATWCAPCRHEMPTLSALQSGLGSEDFSVVTIATGRNDPVAMAQFFDEIGVDNLPLHTDPRSRLAREMGILGLPVTLILNAEGEEIARLQGDADWNSDSAQAIVRALLAE